MQRHKILRGVAMVLAMSCLTQPLWAGKKQETKVRSARWVYEELFGNQKEKIPAALLADTRCIAVFPSLVEAGLVLGGSHGTGVVSCRGDEGKWSPPSFVKISEGSLGLQIGYKASDLVFFFVTEKSTKVLLEKKTTFGGELSSDVYIYAKSRGLFGGASIEGVRLGASPKAIRKFYGHYVWPGQILFDQDVPVMPDEAQEFMDGLNRQAWE